MFNCAQGVKQQILIVGSACMFDFFVIYILYLWIDCHNAYILGPSVFRLSTSANSMEKEEMCFFFIVDMQI